MVTHEVVHFGCMTRDNIEFLKFKLCCKLFAIYVKITAVMVL